MNKEDYVSFMKNNNINHHLMAKLINCVHPTSTGLVSGRYSLDNWQDRIALATYHYNLINRELIESLNDHILLEDDVDDFEDRYVYRKDKNYFVKIDRSGINE